MIVSQSDNNGVQKAAAMGQRSVEPARILSELLPTACHEETHLSHVFITKEDVYKLKKPVELSFCDFSSVGKRHAACLREVDVNRMLAPGLYKGVIPLTRRGETYEIGGDGIAVDWLVHMAPFAGDDRADRALAKGRISPLDFRRFVDNVYLHHERTRHTPDAKWGLRLRAIIDDLARGLLGGARNRKRRWVVLQWRRQLIRKLDQHRALISRRGRTSIVTTCHGDLHLKNLCIFEDQLIAYDALEFDESLVRIDGLYDIGFLIADLWHHGFPQHANAVMNRYIAMDGDYDCVLLMPIYCAIRAGVRAMVSLMSGDTEAADAYMSTAMSFLVQIKDPWSLILSGRSGVGKTTMAQALAPMLLPPPGALHIRSDVIRKRMQGLLPEETLPPRAYAPSQSHKVYAACIDIAQELGGQWPLILDIAFASDSAENPPRLEGLNAEKIWLDVPEDLLIQRLAGRKEDASDATIEVMESQRRWPPRPDWRIVNASGPVAETLSRITEETSFGIAGVHYADYIPAHEI